MVSQEHPIEQPQEVVLSPLVTGQDTARGIPVRITIPDLTRRQGRVPKLYTILKDDYDAYSRMLGFIRRGAYDHVAASSIGIDPTLFATYMTKGRNEYEQKVEASLVQELEPEQADEAVQEIVEIEASVYVKFFLDVTKAKSEARLRMELKVAKDDPKFWLRCGPGRTRGDLPGWTEDTQKIELTGAIEHEHSGEIEHNAAPSTKEDLAKALQTFEDMGLLQRTEKGATLFGESNGEVVEGVFSDEDQD